MNLRGLYSNIKKEDLIDEWLGEELVNMFPTQNAVYSENEVEGIIRNYERISHPQSNEIVSLLHKLTFFLSATTTNSFKQYRDAYSAITIHPRLKAALQEMTEELTEFAARSMESDPETLPILTRAETYCKKSLQKRLNELYVLRDPITDLKEISVLEELLANVQSPSLRR